MRPKNLKVPFSWENRAIYFDQHEKIFYVPPRCDQTLNPLKLEEIIPPHVPIHLEYCSGNGEWICQKALEQPEIFWIGVEKRLARVKKIWSKMKNLNLNNLLIICGEAYEVTARYLADDKIKEAYINFPDPWPKNRHAKFRLVEPTFVKELIRVLGDDGRICFVTDDPTYSMQSIEVFLSQNELVSEIGSPYYSTLNEDYGNSYFKTLWEEKKRSFYFSKFLKTCKYTKDP